MACGYSSKAGQLGQHFEYILFLCGLPSTPRACSVTVDVVSTPNLYKTAGSTNQSTAYHQRMFGIRSSKRNNFGLECVVSFPVDDGEERNDQEQRLEYLIFPVERS